MSERERERERGGGGWMETQRGNNYGTRQNSELHLKKKISVLSVIFMWPL